MKRIIFMGTPQIAVPSLQLLIDSGFEIPLAISQPDRPKGRGGKVQPTPVKEAALAAGIEVYQPEKVKNNPEVLEKLKSLNADFFAVVAYGKILPKEILEVPHFAPINVHFSLLPLYRGAAPVNWAIMNGDERTGVSTMKMDIGMDTGDIMLTEETPIDRKTDAELAAELAVTGAKLLIKTINEYDSITPTPQDHDSATVAPMMRKEDGEIDWNSSAISIERLIRAFSVWPTAHTYLDGKLFKIYSADIDPKGAAAGVVYNVTKSSFSVGTGSGGLIIKEIQPEGKRRMAVADFLAGYKLNGGERFGR
ncbi:MAG: methionyl-tRNA formyltransferase [Deferribacteraceae bacterium]|jgi:methionyl-tRNA formyltransferase|nr:methionyl-tRNA formyltransferase [Deferribacteraceae bacterium]